MAVANEYLNETNMAQEKPKLRYLDPADIRINPRNEGRQTEENIARLCESIKSQGLEQPLKVRPEGDHYVIIAGEGRFRALKAMNFTGFKFDGFDQDNVIPCLVSRNYNFNDEYDEDIAIELSNSQKDETKNEKIAKTKKYADIYLVKKAKNQIEPGKTKRQYISEITGYSESAIQGYLAEIDKKQNKEAKISKAKINPTDKFVDHVNKAYDILQMEEVDFKTKEVQKEIKRKLKIMMEIVDDSI